MPSTEKSYTATITITETTTIASDRPHALTQQLPEVRRETGEVAQVVLRAGSLPELKDKLSAHIALL